MPDPEGEAPDGQVTVARADLWLLLDGTDIIAPEASADQVEAAVARLRATLNASLSRDLAELEVRILEVLCEDK